MIRSFSFTTAKALIIVINLSEDRIGEGEAWEKKIETAGLPKSTAVVACSAQSEMEIAEMGEESERREFLDSFGISEPAADRIIRVSYAALGLISFFTVGPTEVHAWTVRDAALVTEAAGTIHTDMERGFIRADVIGYEELVKCGLWTAAKKEGKLRLEGKAYRMRDGDVIEVRFSV